MWFFVIDFYFYVVFFLYVRLFNEYEVYFVIWYMEFGWNIIRILILNKGEVNFLIYVIGGIVLKIEDY